MEIDSPRKEGRLLTAASEDSTPILSTREVGALMWSEERCGFLIRKEGKGEGKSSLLENSPKKKKSDLEEENVLLDGLLLYAGGKKKKRRDKKILDVRHPSERPHPRGGSTGDPISLNRQPSIIRGRGGRKELQRYSLKIARLTILLSIMGKQGFVYSTPRGGGKGEEEKSRAFHSKMHRSVLAVRGKGGCQTGAGGERPI